MFKNFSEHYVVCLGMTIMELVNCFFCNCQFYTDRSTGENLDLNNTSPLCPSCGLAEDKELEKSEKIVDKDKTRSIIDKSKGKSL